MRIDCISILTFDCPMYMQALFGVVRRQLLDVIDTTFIPIWRIVVVTAAELNGPSDKERRNNETYQKEKQQILPSPIPNWIHIFGLMTRLLDGCFFHSVVRKKNEKKTNCLTFFFLIIDLVTSEKSIAADKLLCCNRLSSSNIVKWTKLTEQCHLAANPWIYSQLCTAWV